MWNVWSLDVFQVKPYEASEAETSLLVSISEPIKVGHEVSKQFVLPHLMRHLLF